MFDELQREDVQEFMRQNASADVNLLALKKNPFPELDYKWVLNQIAARAKAKNKLPTWHSNPLVVFPSKISLEQTSSERTSNYKANLVSGNSLIDLSGGFGVDSYFFSKRVDSLVHCERDVDLSALSAYNFKLFHADNVEFITDDSSAFLKNSGRRFDWIYVDPSRRNESKGKVFLLSDCEPNVPYLLDLYFSVSDKILIKTAPLLDLSAGLKELSNVREIHVVAVDNEVKELLWVIEKDYEGQVKVRSANLSADSAQIFEYTFNSDPPEIEYSEPLRYLYEPNAALLKSGAFVEIANAFDVKKLQRHSHLYTSNDLRTDFPGRQFEVISWFDFEKEKVKAMLKGGKANVTIRNFPESVENLRKKFNIREGGDRYCFFTTHKISDKIVVICAKI